MSSSTRFFAFVLLTLLCASGSLRAQSQSKTTAKTPGGSVSGRVTIKDKPAVGVTVGLRKTAQVLPMEKTYRAITDQEGVYRIANVPAGTYEIAPAAPAYVAATDANYPRGKNVIVGDDEEVEDINFSLVRGGVITGKITDADGRPLVQQPVYLYRASDFQQQPMRQVFSANSVQTDDRGIYRFFGLAAGRYKVASGRGDETAGNYYEPSRVVYKQVYHPDAMDQSKATIIEVREGSEAANVDITLGVAMQTYSVSGRVVADKGTPVPNIRFGFQRRTGERLEFSDLMAVSNSKGEFVVDGLQTGKYGIMLFSDAENELRAEGTVFDVVDGDVTGLTVRLIRGSSISGVIVIEPEDKKLLASLSEFQVRGYVSAGPNAPTVGQSVSSPIGPDGSFRLGGLSSGQLNVWLEAPFGANPPKGFSILRTEHNGVALGRGIEIKDGDQLTGVRLVIAYGTASVHGSVKIENGSLPDGGRMFARLFKAGTPPTNIANSMVDARNQFLLEGIPPGVYELAVTAYIQQKQVTSRREINVQDGVANEVSITLDLAPQPKP